MEDSEGFGRFQGARGGIRRNGNKLSPLQGRREEEGGVRRKGAGIAARKEKGQLEKRVKRRGRREIGD